MKKLMVFGLSLFFLFVSIELASAVRINEVMANTPKDIYGDSDCEWIEIYTESSQNLTNWSLDTGMKKNFNFYIQDFLIITGNKTCFIQNWLNVNESIVLEWYIGLNNKGDNVSLFNATLSLISNVSYPNFENYANKSYSLLSNLSWIICDKPTPGSANSCNSSGPPPPQNPPPPTNSSNASIYLRLDWNEDDIINGEEFDIEVLAFNLKNENYDIKVYIKPEDEETIISEVYDEVDEKWISGTYYVNEIFEGSGNKNGDFRLRIKSSHNDFSGDAEIIAKIRKSDSSVIIDEVKEDIEILEKESDNKNNTSETQKTDKTTEEKTSSVPITGGVIKLGNRQAETENEKENVLYESKSEKIKKYSIYGLNIILIIIVIFLLKLKKKKV